MIGDSNPWKVELLRIADRLEKRMNQKRWTERTYFLVERDIMVAAYAIRKLIEAKKLSDDVTSKRVVGMQFELLGRVPDLMTYDDLARHYDLNTGRGCSLSLTDFCNQIIHSFVWLIAATDCRFSGVFFSSDRMRRRNLYLVPAEMLVEMLRDVGYDDVVSMQMERDAHGELKVTSLLGGDTRTARYEWLMTGGSPAAQDVRCAASPL